MMTSHLSLVRSAALSVAVRAPGALALCAMLSASSGCSEGSTGPSSDLRAVVAVSAAYDHTCALTAGGAVSCWGNGWQGQLGDGLSFPSATPVPVAGDLRFRQLSAGSYHTCGITVAGAAYCWGYNRTGQLGSDSITVDAGSMSNVPLRVAAGLTFVAISAGDAHTCAIASGGAAYCWGANDRGQLGDGDTTLAVTPVRALGNVVFAAVSAGRTHTCGVTPDGQVYCWGDNRFGQLGDGTTTSRAEPVQVARLP